MTIKGYSIPGKKLLVEDSYQHESEFDAFQRNAKKKALKFGELIRYGKPSKR